ncbi:MAG: DUF389 domain-containing protein [Novosphingobium sp.]|nr:DUF389 domain-containing protein [Novosphingobium sp.]
MSDMRGGKDPLPIAAQAVTASTKTIPMGVRLRRLRAWLRFIRIRFAKAVLLPELTGSEAQDLRQTVRKEGDLTSGYILMCALSAGIATLGMLQSSTAVVIGAMLISPLMNPIAALGFGFASLDGRRIREAVRVVAIGAAIGILTAVLLTWLSPIRNATPEILSRTQPTLLDLGIALFSGLAGGYATVIGKGGTAIGVAIATALMPPLAVLGYGLGVLQFEFALGAFLLFLTNLAAITFSFALIARLSGAARPLFRVEWQPRYVAVLAGAFIALAIPLSTTLVRITQEGAMLSAARTAIVEACGGRPARVTQIDVSWPLFGDPTVDALVISPTYSPNAEADAEKRLAEILDEKVDIHLQQIQATDIQSQTSAMIDAAMERTTAGIAADVPPYDKIRASIGLPTESIWINRAERRVYVEPVRAPEWTLFDYAQTELAANKVSDKWNVRVLPPPQAMLRVNIGDPGMPAAGTISPELAGWALLLWGMDKVVMEAPDSESTKAFIKGLAEKGITVFRRDPAADIDVRGRRDKEAQPIAVIRVYSISPSQAAKRAAAAAEAKKKAEAAKQAEAKP